MKIISIALGYLRWHYSRALKSIIGIWRNFLYFVTQFFSFSLLIKNFFAPWKRMSDPYPHNFIIKDYIFSFIVNLITRLVGIIMRLGLFLIGLFVYIFLALLLPVVLVAWLLLPLILISLIIIALYLII